MAGNMETPTLVFIPGSWHKPSCYDKTIKPLQDRGIKCLTVTLPSTTGDRNLGLKADVDAARAIITSETTQGHNVIVIAHSYGGMVGNSVIKGLARPKNAPASSTHGKGYVVALILIASGFSITGVAFMAPLGNKPPPYWRRNDQTGMAELISNPHDLFYHDVAKSESDHHVAQLAPQSLKALFEDGEYVYAGWRDVPTWYIGTIEDHGLPILVQRMQVPMVRAQGATVTWRELWTSHSPFISQPNEVVGIILEAVDAVKACTTWGQAIAQAPADLRKIVVPGTRILSPLSWFQYGVPSVFGHLIGGGFVCYRGAKRLWRSVFGGNRVG
ncbi:hypothetical protein HDV00_003020 [Rhizophlyctis rosea]|nr:hypothetical protein HDV00_003020 [Rhizophlyctis rosea]